MDENTVFGILKIKGYFVVAQDDDGRETLAKWVTLANHYAIPLEEAQRITAEYKAKVNKGILLHCAFETNL